MSVRRIAFVAYSVFLAGYSWYKYQVAAPAEFSSAYLQSVAVLVLMTGVAPFFLALATAKLIRVSGLARIALGLIAGLVFCVAGYAEYFTLFIAGNVPGVTLIDVALRGAGWGLAQGALAAMAAHG